MPSASSGQLYSAILRIAAAGAAVAIQYPYQPLGPPFPDSCTEVWNAETGKIARFQGLEGCALGPDGSVAFDGDELAWTSGHSRPGLPGAW